MSHIIAPTQAEGPGQRLAVWFRGCRIRCPGCCNPELFEPGPATYGVSDVLARTAGVEGLTFLGGEPVDQAAGAAELAHASQAAGLSVMVFSGYLRKHIERLAPDLLSATDILVDGPYLADRPEPKGGRRWIGSTNQSVHFLTARYGPADFHGPNTVELRLSPGRVLVNGWPHGRSS